MAVNYLPDLRDKEGSHTGSGTTTKGVGQLESLQTVASLSLLPHNVQDRVNQLSSWKIKQFISKMKTAILDMGKMGLKSITNQ